MILYFFKKKIYINFLIKGQHVQPTLVDGKEHFPMPLYIDLPSKLLSCQLFKV